MKKNKNLFVLLLLLAITVVAYSSTFLYVKLNKSERNTDELLIMTSCNPVYIATLNIVGDTDGVRVENLSQPTTGCLHDYTLTTEDMKNLNYADALIISGAGMEGYLDDVIEAYPDLTIIDASLGLDLLSAEEDEHNHEEEEHDHGDVNSHYWLASSCYIKSLFTISDGLCKLSSKNTDAFTENCNAYVEKIYEELTPVISEAYKALAGEDIAVLHEAYGYIALETGSEIVCDMDLDEERQVSAGEVAMLISEIQEHDVKLVLAEEDYGKSMGDLIEEQTDAKVVYLNTLIHGKYHKDSYILEMIKNYSLINENLKELED